MTFAGRACPTVGRACRDLALLVAGTWLAAELVHRLAAPSLVERVETSSTETLLVLGCPSGRDGRPSALQRWRVDSAARNAGPATRFVFSGADEAGVMAADLTTRHGISPSRATLELLATNTWENIGLSAPLIEPGGVVRIVSDPLHARRGERYWRLRVPERADELRPAALYRFGERPVLKVLTASYALVLRGLRYRPSG